MAISDLPALNATLNGTAGVLLVIGLVLIRQGRREAHRRCMISAFVCSCVFLVTYVIHKILVRGVHTPIGAEGFIKTLYYLMLFTHVVLAIAVVPLALISIRRGLSQQFDQHRKIARIAWPIWMYVSVTGVLIYFMLYRWFPSAAHA